ncbi:MAG: hypothetical protein R3A47_00110 [Polyangiales bacterium]
MLDSESVSFDDETTSGPILGDEREDQTLIVDPKEMIKGQSVPAPFAGTTPKPSNAPATESSIASWSDRPKIAQFERPPTTAPERKFSFQSVSAATRKKLLIGAGAFLVLLVCMSAYRTYRQRVSDRASLAQAIETQKAAQSTALQKVIDAQKNWAELRAAEKRADNEALAKYRGELDGLKLNAVTITEDGSEEIDQVKFAELERTHRSQLEAKAGKAIKEGKYADAFRDFRLLSAAYPESNVFAEFVVVLDARLNCRAGVYMDGEPCD